jgi:uncharacterized protein (TIGR02246 family)
MHWQRFRTPLIVTALATATVLVGTVVRPGPRPAEAAGQDPPRPREAARSDPGAAPADESAIRKAAADYVAAMNKGDLNAILAFWAPEAEYVAEGGRVTRGKEAIGRMFRDALPDLKGHKITVREHSLRTLRPDVAMEDGSLEFCGPDGCKEFNRYAVVWTKADGKWLIASARDLPAGTAEAPSMAYPHLQALEWLVGEWTDETAKIDVRLNCRWAPNKAFLLLDYEVKREGQDAMQVTQRIGWDASEQVVRSWVFDSHGGFGEGQWQKDGRKWVVASAGVLPDGGTGTATNVWEFVDGQHFVWRAVDREVDGQPVGDMEVKFVRKAPKEGGRP